MIRCGARCFPPRPRFVGCADRPRRTPAPPSGQGRRVVRAGCLDDGAALVAGRADGLLEEGAGDPVGVVVGIDDQEVDGPDEAAGAHRRAEGEDGPADDVALRLGDEDAGLRQVDELAEQVGGIERARATVDTTVSVAQRDETIDIRDTGGSDQVFHAEGSHLAGRRPLPLDRGRSDRGPGPAGPRSRASMRARHALARCGEGMRPTGVAFGSPSAYDTASLRRSPARRSSSVLRAVRHAPPLAPADALGGHRRRGRAHEGGRTAVACPDRAGAQVASDRGSLRDRRTIRSSRRRMHEATRSGHSPPPPCSPSRRAAAAGGGVASKGDDRDLVVAAAPGLEQGPDGHDRQRHQHGDRREGRRRRRLHDRLQGRRRLHRRGRQVGRGDRDQERQRRRRQRQASWRTSARSTRARRSCRSRSSASKGIVDGQPGQHLSRPDQGRQGRAGRAGQVLPERLHAELHPRRRRGRPPGSAGALWASQLGVKNVYVLDDTELYGKGIADVFAPKAPSSA